MFNRFINKSSSLRKSIRMCRDMQMLAPSAQFRGFAAKSREEMPLNPKWLEVAKAETKGRIDIREKLIRVTNE